MICKICKSTITTLPNCWRRLKTFESAKLCSKCYEIENKHRIDNHLTFMCNKGLSVTVNDNYWMENQIGNIERLLEL